MKIHSPYTDIVNKAIAENISVEFVSSSEQADLTLPKLPLPAKLNEILNYIESAGNNQIAIGKFKLSTGRKILSQNGTELELTAREAEVLTYLAKSNSAVSKDDLVKHVWNYSDESDTNTVESHIYRLRQKISATFKTEIIITEGSNYKIVEN